VLSMTHSCCCEIFEGSGEIARATVEWEASARAAKPTLPYCGPGYARALIECYHADDAPILVRAGAGKATAYLLTVKRPLRRLGYRIQERGFPFNSNTILNDPLLRDPTLAPDQACVLLTAAFPRNTETLILDHLPVDGLAVEFLRSAAQKLGCGADAPTAARTLYHAKLPGDWETYLATRSRNHRWQIRKALKTVADNPEISVDRLTGRDQIRAALPDWFSVETRSWQGQDPASAMNEADRAFHTRLLDTLNDDEVGDLWMVRFGARPVAALRMLSGPGLTSVHTMHFDLAHKRKGPGLMAFAAMMKTACEAGLEEVDMHGDTEFFARWATGTRAHQSVRFYRPGLRGRALQAARKWSRECHELRVSGPVLAVS